MFMSIKAFTFDEEELHGMPQKICLPDFSMSGFFLPEIILLLIYSYEIANH
jgi:hypothetical protein